MLAEAGASDIVFVVMQQGQMLAALPLVAAADTPLVVLVGNNLHVDEALSYLAEHAPEKTTLFAFQATAGRREADHVECARVGASGMTVGAARGEAPDAAIDLLDRAFAQGAYRAKRQADMRDWLVCHAAAVLPLCYVAYRLDCDLTRATTEDLTDLIDATGEAYAALSELGYRILPEGEEGFYAPGPKRTAWLLILQVIAKSFVGRLCVTDHCRAAAQEMHDLDRDFMAIIDALPSRQMPTWDRLREAMPDWNELEERWNVKANTVISEESEHGGDRDSGGNVAFWNRFAFVYDLVTRSGDTGLAEAASYVASFVRPTDVVLDAACGTDTFACALASSAGFVAACDFAPAMVEQAAAKVGRLGLGNVACGPGDLMELDFADETFDAVVAGNVLHLLGDPQRAVDELLRVTRPGGIIAIPNYVNAEAQDKRFLRLIEAAGFTAAHEWDEQGFLAFLADAGLVVAEHRSFVAKQPLCVAICRKPANENTTA